MLNQRVVGVTAISLTANKAGYCVYAVKQRSMHNCNDSLRKRSCAILGTIVTFEAAATMRAKLSLLLL
jgi:hypothetical protein